MNQVATKKEGALQTNLFEADANQGAQNISQEDLALPFLKILGQLSPEVNKRDGKYVEGAEPGLIINISYMNRVIFFVIPYITFISINKRSFANGQISNYFYFIPIVVCFINF